MGQMKDSGIEWIGEIPAEWEVRKCKFFSTLYTGNSIKDDEKSFYEDNELAHPYISSKDIDGDTLAIDYNNGMYIKDDDTNFVCADKEDILVCVEGGSAGRKIAFLDRKVSFVNKLCCYHSYDVCNKYLYYSVLSPSYKSEFDLNLTGLIGGVSRNKLMNFKFAYPSLPEQQRIAAYLDAKCGEIDKVMTKTRESIAEYKKLKQSIITEAVTKGVDGERPMKDSGIEWIGQIPAEWEVLMAFQLFDEIGTLNVNLQEKNLLSLSYGKIIRKDIDTKSGLLPESFETYNIVESNDIVLRLTDLQNDHRSLRVGISGERGIVTSAYVSLRSKSNNLPRYLYYYLHSFDIAKGFYGMGAGVRQGLNWNGLKHLKITVPSLTEQQRIVAYLDKKCSEIDNLIAKKEQLLTELEKYKKSLIYECVTGKREVG